MTHPKETDTKEHVKPHVTHEPAAEPVPEPEPAPEPLKVGDTVLLKGVQGAVPMTIRNIVNNDCTCAWFGTTGEFHQHLFHAGELEVPAEHKKKKGK